MLIRIVHALSQAGYRKLLRPSANKEQLVAPCMQQAVAACFEPAQLRTGQLVWEHHHPESLSCRATIHVTCDTDYSLERLATLHPWETTGGSSVSNTLLCSLP